MVFALRLRAAGSILMNTAVSLWVFIMAVLMWRNSSRGRIARPESAPPEPANPPASAG
jgi:hypothetical protein